MNQLSWAICTLNVSYFIFLTWTITCIFEYAPHQKKIKKSWVSFWTPLVTKSQKTPFFSIGSRLVEHIHTILKRLKLAVMYELCTCLHLRISYCSVMIIKLQESITKSIQERISFQIILRGQFPGLSSWWIPSVDEQITSKIPHTKPLQNPKILSNTLKVMRTALSFLVSFTCESLYIQCTVKHLIFFVCFFMFL